MRQKHCSGDVLTQVGDEHSKSQHPMKREYKALSRYLPALLRVGVTLATISLLFKLYDSDDVFSLLSAVGIPTFAIAAGFYALCMLVSAWKWGVPLEHVSFRSRLRAVIASNFYSILPSGQLGGELSKVFIIKSSHPDAEHVLASVIFDKVTAVLGLLLIGMASFCLASPPPFHWQILLIAVLTTGCACTLFATRAASKLTRTFSISQPYAQRMQNFISGLLQSIDRYSRDPSKLLNSIALGIASQVTVILVYAIIASALDIHIPHASIVSAIVLANLATLLPISAGGSASARPGSPRY